MTIEDHIRAKEREITMELATFNFVRNLLNKGCDVCFIADATQLSIKKQKILSKKLRILLTDSAILIRVNQLMQW